MDFCQIYLLFIVEFRQNIKLEAMKRIGFITSNIYQGVSVALWKAFSALLREHPDTALFIFPGGRINPPGESEGMRSFIYKLTGKDSLDGAIVWSSSLSGTFLDDAVGRFVTSLSDEIPVMAIGRYHDGIPSVSFDAYGGMKALVSHFIEVHGERRIAFIRGPESHESAEERFQAYRDALSAHGIAFDESLVSSPHDWDDGRAAAEELLVSRALSPGKDFTSIIGASDLLVTAAAIYMGGIGIRIPEDIRIGGFNDTEDNLRLPVGLTTVHLPIERMAEESFRGICSLIEGNEAGNVFIRTTPVIRHSCGCMSRNKHLGTEEINQTIDDIRSGKDIQPFIERSGNLEDLLDSIQDEDDSAVLYRRVAMAYRRAEAESRIRVRGLSRILDSFKTELLAAKSYSMIPPLMKEFFPGTGIHSAFLVLFSGASSVMRAGFSGEMIYSSPFSFPLCRILPEEICQDLRGGVYIVEPLYSGTIELGYIVLGMEGNESYIAESLRASFSSAVKGITLFEEVEKARDEARKEEYEAEMFYSNISEGVLLPISEMRAMLQSDSSDREKLSLKLSEAEHILRLAMIQRSGFSVEERLIPFDMITEDLRSAGFLPDIPSGMPSFLIDKKMFMEMMKLIQIWCSSFSGALGENGLALSFDVGVSCEGSSSIILAERMAFLSSFGFSLHDGRLCIMIHYPRLKGASPSPEGRHGVLFIGGSEASIPEPIRSIASTVNDNPSVVAWINGDADAEDIVEYRGLPMACFALGEEYQSLDDALFPCGRIIVMGDAMIPPYLSSETVVRVGSREEALEEKGAKLIILSEARIKDAVWFRSEASFSSVPIIFMKDRFQKKDAEGIAELPVILFANPSYLESPEAGKRLQEIIKGSPMLPGFTALSVRKAIAYMNEKAGSMISRWQVAEAAGVNEDYLSRIFHKEMGISPWEYLNRYRIQIASSLLSSTSLSIRDIAAMSGFQDPAYFSRVFRKIKGMTAGEYRKRK